jgi:hypothetical protein
MLARLVLFLSIILGAVPAGAMSPEDQKIETWGKESLERVTKNIPELESYRDVVCVGKTVDFQQARVRAAKMLLERRVSEKVDLEFLINNYLKMDAASRALMDPVFSVDALYRRNTETTLLGAPVARIYNCDTKVRN